MSDPRPRRQARLLLRADLTENVLRSVDDHPGIVGIGCHDGEHYFMVDTKWMPGAELRKQLDEQGAGVALDVRNIPEADRDDIRLDVDVVVAACETTQEMAMVAQYSAGAVATALAMHGGRFAWEIVRGACDFAIDVRDALNRRAQEMTDAGTTE